MVAEIIAAIIFVVMFVMIVASKLERHIVTLIAGALTLIVVFGLCMHSMTAVSETLNLSKLVEPSFWYQKGTEAGSSGGINWETIIFIAGMMIMVEGMSEAGFFRWLCMRIAKLVNYKPIAIFLTFMILAGVLSMFIDSITVILFLAAVTIELARLLQFDPIPFIMAEIFCANLGGSATMCGDPPNIIIGTSLGYTFGDFVSNTGIIAAAAAVAIIIYFYLVLGKKIKKNGIADLTGVDINPKNAITDKKKFICSSFVFAVAVVLLINHAALGLTVATIGVIVAILTSLIQPKDAIRLIKNIDYKTLLFFIGLFIVIGGLEQTGVLESIAAMIQSFSNGSVVLTVIIIVWVSAIASAFVDNIPFAATMIPVIRSISMSAGIDLPLMAWSLAMGTDLGGSATPIGASANVVGISIANKEGYSIGWGKYCKLMIPATVIAIAISTVFLCLRCM
ncbi:MAG: SLC13 family permease [Bacillota bacterium]|nr:SLC13 family permease [Bacillota bacterium]